MKLLLLTDIPPCKTLTAGLVLHQLCEFLPRDSVACFAVVNPNLSARLSPSLGWMRVEYAVKPREFGENRSGRIFRTAKSYLREVHSERVKVRIIAKAAARFGRESSVDTLWCVLQGQTMIRLAKLVADELNIPLLTQVWDPPGWWLRANRVDQRSCRKILGQFEETLRHSKCCATASWAMASEYNKKYGCKTVPVISSRDLSVVSPAADGGHDGDHLVIGMAGQLYSGSEWEILITALDNTGWQVVGRNVKIRLLGHSATLNADTISNIEFLGWRSQEEAVRLMSSADILYCPYWFDPTFEEEARLCFPSKLITYLAAGRPVLFHGPAYSSPALFLSQNEAGMICSEPSATDLLQAIERLATDRSLRAKYCRNGNKAFREHFTLEVMREHFAEFLDIDAKNLN